MNNTYIIGPSHLSPTFTGRVKQEIEAKTLFQNCILEPFRGVPNWAKKILDRIEEYSSKGYSIVWMVSDYKFSNVNYNTLVNPETTKLFLEDVGYDVVNRVGQINKAYMETHHIEFLGNHSLKCIDYIVEKYPHVRLVFWCLYKRTKVNKSSYPPDLWYDVIKERYKKNIIDFDLFTTPEKFNKQILDDCAHPNREGFILLDKMVRSINQ
jgi:hypothetical protein